MRSGNLTLKKRGQNKTSYKYDALNRLTEVITATEKTTYTYDPFHRRTSKTSFLKEEGNWQTRNFERYLYQGDKEIGTIGSDGSIKELRVMGVGNKGDIGAAVLMEFDGRLHVPLHDCRGNVALLLDAVTGLPVETYRYSAYGEEKIYDATNTLTSHPLNPWRFSSKRVDPETGLSFFGARHYDRQVGRWTTPDPLWFVDGTNLYCYVANRPALFIDPDGLFLEDLFETVCP